MDRFWSPLETYELILKVGSEDLTPDLISARIVSTIDLPYQHVVLELLYNPNDVITKKIFGQKPIQLTINLLSTSRFPLESITMELVYLESNMDLQSQIAISTGKQVDRKLISITTVPKNAFVTMSQYVNDVFLNQNLRTVVQSLAGTSVKMKYDSDGQNTTILDQVVIQPTYFYEALGYLDKRWGFFDGVASYFCLYDNILYIKNLSKKISKAAIFTVYQLATDIDNSEIFDKCIDGKTFYTMDELNTTYKANTDFARLGTDLKFVVSPKDSLTYTIQESLQDICTKYGLIDKNTKFYVNDLVTNRTSVYTNHVGYNKTKTFVYSNIARQIATTTDLSLRINGSIKLKNLMKIGEPFQVISKIAEKSQIVGKFILSASEVTFERKRDWFAEAIIYGIRTNRTLS